MLRYHERVTDCKVLGPCEEGSRGRAVIWTHGCPFQCEGCIAENYRSGSNYIETSEEEMADWYLSHAEGQSGITISGGEPMLQAGALARVLELIRRDADAGVIVYTGYVYERLLEMVEKDSGIRSFLGCIDLLIDGPYQKQKDINRYAVGSENQRLLLLTDRYRGRTEDYYKTGGGRSIEIRCRLDQTLLIGVPSAEQAKMWKILKRTRLIGENV